MRDGADASPVASCVMMMKLLPCILNVEPLEIVRDILNIEPLEVDQHLPIIRE
jgi:hypothetical protein